ncbi:MAG: phosphatase PAP2 family protein [Actinomycetota bacterium]|jgi:undecaprenyl-diphosphatase|nr:phosphatase PAP2 family protein [Actinomycetota bacterium]
MAATGGALSASVKVLWPEGLNSRFYLDVNSFSRHTAWAHGFMHAYALWLGLTIMTVLFLLAYALAWWRRDGQAVALLFLGGVGTLVALGLNQVVGHAAKERRPYDTYRHALVLVAKAHDYAFPSDHAVVAGALFVSLLLVLRRAGPHRWRVGGSAWGTSRLDRRVTPEMLVLVVLGALAGLLLLFARVYVGAHYPGDVVAGVLLGAVVVVVLSLLRSLAYWLVDAIGRTPLALFVGRPAGR